LHVGAKEDEEERGRGGRLVLVGVLGNGGREGEDAGWKGRYWSSS